MAPDIELALAARAENIAIVRHALGGLGDALAIAPDKLDDIRIAVSEACANVVLHAYPPGSDGQMLFAATAENDRLVVSVRDWGSGVRPRPDSPGLGLGLSMIAALAEEVQLGHDSERHTEVRMTFSLNGSAGSAGATDSTRSAGSTGSTEHASTGGRRA